MMGGLPSLVYGEYRAYLLEVVPLRPCLRAEQEACTAERVLTALAPALYVSSHGGAQVIAARLLATWVCRGNTSGFEAVCAIPPARGPRFRPAQRVRVTLVKHVTEGWEGVIELAYYQELVRSNVYGVRFPAYEDTYARYYESDLRLLAASSEADPAVGRGSGIEGERPPADGVTP